MSKTFQLSVSDFNYVSFSFNFLEFFDTKLLSISLISLALILVISTALSFVAIKKYWYDTAFEENYLFRFFRVIPMIWYFAFIMVYFAVSLCFCHIFRCLVSDKNWIPNKFCLRKMSLCRTKNRRFVNLPILKRVAWNNMIGYVLKMLRINTLLKYIKCCACVFVAARKHVPAHLPF